MGKRKANNHYPVALIQQAKRIRKETAELLQSDLQSVKVRIVLYVRFNIIRHHAFEISTFDTEAMRASVHVYSFIEI